MVRRTIRAASACLAIAAVGAGLALAVQQKNPSITLQAACCPAGTAALPAGPGTIAAGGTPVNAKCPVCGKSINGDAATVDYNGFRVGLCCGGCEAKFQNMSGSWKDEFIAALVQPSRASCAISGCPDGPQAARVTHAGKVYKLCCPACQTLWHKSDAKLRSGWIAKNASGKIASAVDSADEEEAPLPTPPACSSQIRMKRVYGSDDVAVQLEGTLLRVEGITCQACIDTIGESLSKVAGVKAVAGSVVGKLIWVGYDPAAKMENDVLLKATEKAGFKAAVFEGAIVQTARSSDASAEADDTKTKSESEPKSAKPSEGASASPISLDGSLKPLVERFNAAKGKFRFVTILSPT